MPIVYIRSLTQPIANESNLYLLISAVSHSHISDYHLIGERATSRTMKRPHDLDELALTDLLPIIQPS